MILRNLTPHPIHLAWPLERGKEVVVAFENDAVVMCDPIPGGVWADGGTWLPASGQARVWCGWLGREVTVDVVGLPGPDHPEPRPAVVRFDGRTYRL